MRHSHGHAHRHSSHHHRRAYHAAHGAAAGAAGGAAFAGAGTLGARYIGQQQATEMAEAALDKLPKNMVTGLAIGFLVGGAAGIFLLRDQDGGHAARVSGERQNAGGRAL